MCLFYLVLILSISLISARKFVVEECTTDSGQRGFCRDQESCGQDNVSASGCSTAGTVCCPRRQITKTKCKEYELVSKKYSGKTCKRTGSSPLIIGGEPAVDGEFPHMVALGQGKRPKIKYVCGGSLISELFVVTAAHCFRDKPIKIVKLGALKLSEEGHDVRYKYIDQVITHPKHYRRKNDIALVKLMSKVDFNPKIYPICLHFDGQDMDDKQLATGWGWTNEDEEVMSDTLQKVELDIIDTESCSLNFRLTFGPGGVPGESIICLGKEEGKDTCQGDSGGPIHNKSLRKDVCMFVLNGVTSYGNFCGKKMAALYTRIWHYLPWIESHVWPGQS